MKERLFVILTIGHIVRRERLNIKMKQSYLANGICSPSYLSKIENNETIPSNEILELLSKKLGINFNEINLTKYDEEDNKSKIQDIYKEVTVNKNIEFAKLHLTELIDQRLLYVNKEIYYAYNILVLRLILVVKENYETIDLYLDPLIKDTDKLNSYEYYLLNKIQGIYSFQLKMYSQSVTFFEAAILAAGEIPLSNWESADLNYMYSLSNLSDSHSINAIEYSNLSLQYFLENFQFERAIECFIIQGIAYKNSNKHKEALNSFQKANEISEKFESNYYIALIAQNLGSLHASLKEFDASLTHFLKSLKLKTKLEDRLLSIFSIIQIYSRQNNQEKVYQWVNQGLNEIGNGTSFQNYCYHFNLYRMLNIEEIGEFDEIDINYMSDAINYFESINDYRHTYKYCIKMGDVLENRNKYKLSSYFYKKAILFNNKKLKYEYWEDI